MEEGLQTVKCDAPPPQQTVPYNQAILTADSPLALGLETV